MRRAMLAVAVAVVSLFSVAALGQAGTCSGMTAGQLTSLNGFVPFPSANLWNTDISTLPVDPNSTNIINFMDLVEASTHYPCVKRAWVEYLGEHPEPALDRVE